MFILSSNVQCLAGKIHIVVNGLYIPRNQKFAVSRQLYFCADPRCIAIKPFASNIQTPPSEVDVMRDSQLSSEDICLFIYCSDQQI